MANYLASSAAAELGSLVHLDNGSDASSEDDDFLLEDIDATTEEGRQLLLDILLALRTETEEAQEMLSKEGIERATRDVRDEAGATSSNSCCGVCRRVCCACMFIVGRVQPKLLCCI
mmetsp:Transcript_36398/g.69834  ORF Transcript_36398/g.69834 Transcript_36398/m.69834 type:complete len:117 (+) Transcript_36398:180-530(+)